MKKTIAAVAASLSLVLACGVSAPARAQNVTRNGAPDPATTAAVKKLFEAMHYRTLMAGVMQQMSQNMDATVRIAAQTAIKTNPRLDAAGREKALVQLDARMPGMIDAVRKFIGGPALIDEIVDRTMVLYAREYTVDEIGQIAAFYRSPVGAKTLALTPKLASESMQISHQTLMRKLGPFIEQLQQLQENQQQ